MQLNPHQLFRLQNVAAGESITLNLELCRSFTYPWLELVIDRDRLVQLYTHSIVSRAFQTLELSLVGVVTLVKDDYGDSRVITVEVPRVDNGSVLVFTFHADRLNTPNPRVYYRVIF